MLTKRINRYIMECKLKNSIGFPVAADELIDTLWNVNLRTKRCGITVIKN